MNKTHLIRIVFAAILLAFLGGCATAGQSQQDQEESAIPSSN